MSLYRLFSPVRFYSMQNISSKILGRPVIPHFTSLTPTHIRPYHQIHQRVSRSTFYPPRQWSHPVMMSRVPSMPSSRTYASSSFRPTRFLRTEKPQATAVSSPNPAEVTVPIGKVIRSANKFYIKTAAIPPPKKPNRGWKHVKTLAYVFGIAFVLQKCITLALRYYFPVSSDADFDVKPSYQYQHLTPTPDNSMDVVKSGIIEQNLAKTMANIQTVTRRADDITTSIETFSSQLRTLFKLVERIQQHQQQHGNLANQEEVDKALETITDLLMKCVELTEVSDTITFALTHSANAMVSIVDGWTKLDINEDDEPILVSRALYDELIPINKNVIDNHHLCDELVQCIDTSYNTLTRIDNILTPLFENPNDPILDQKLFAVVQILEGLHEDETAQKLIGRFKGRGTITDGEVDSPAHLPIFGDLTPTSSKPQ